MNTILIRIVKGAIIGAIASEIVDRGSKAIIEAGKNIKNKIDNSENIQEIKKRYKLRSEEGIITVDYEEV